MLSEHVEVVGGHYGTGDRLGLFDAGDREAPARPNCGVDVDSRLLLQPLVERFGDVFAGPDAYQPIGLGIGQRLQQHCVDNAEDRRVGPHPECNGDDGDAGKRNVAEQVSERVSEVLRKAEHGTHYPWGTVSPGWGNTAR